MLLEVGLAGDVNNEIVSFKLLDVGGSLIRYKQFLQIVLDSAQLLHDLVSEVSLALFVGLLELDNHELSHGLKIIDVAGLGLRKLLKLLTLKIVIKVDFAARQLGL